MQFQETKAREIELLENNKDESPLNLLMPLRNLFRFIPKLCNSKFQEEERVHRNRHCYHHRHNLCRHLCNCFVQASTVSDPDSFSSSEVPTMTVKNDQVLPSFSRVEDPGVFQNFLTPPEQPFIKSSKTYVCSKIPSINAETSSIASIDESVAQSKTSVTLNIPSPTTGFFAFSSSNSTSSKSSSSGYEASASTRVSVKIMPQHAHGRVSQEKETGPSAENKDLTLERQNVHCQLKGAYSRPSLKRPHISAQTKDNTFSSLVILNQSANNDVTLNYGAWQRLRTLCRKITEKKQFTFLIMSAILLNMICMGLEHYEQVGVLHFALKLA